MRQASLFDGHHRGSRPMSIQTPAARATDPETSHEAAESITASGERRRQQVRVLALIVASPGCTAGELAEVAAEWDVGVDYFAIQRRVSELEPQFVRRGESRTCSVRRTKQTTIWPVGE